MATLEARAHESESKGGVVERMVEELLPLGRKGSMVLLGLHYRALVTITSVQSGVHRCHATNTELATALS